MAEPNLQEVHDFLVSLAREAGKMITTAKPTMGATGSKKNSADLVTETDKAVEEHVSSSLKKKFPECSFMGEETYKTGDKLTEAPTFIVDPIDGTTNFVHGHPYISISLGFAVKKEPVVGIVYNPFIGMMYSGMKGAGSHLQMNDGEKHKLPLREPEPLKALSSCLVATEWGSDRSGNDFEVRKQTFANLCASPDIGGGMVHGIRSLGSAALNLSGVAAGHLDCYWEAGCWAWDVCAGWCILKEAGGMIVDANPGNWDPRVEERRYLAVRAGEGQKQLIEEFWTKVIGKFEVGVDTVK